MTGGKNFLILQTCPQSQGINLKLVLTQTAKQEATHTHTHAYCCDPREQASCVCAGAVTPALIINQWANCKRTQSASLAHITSPMHVDIHRVYMPFKGLGPLQYSWLIITDGRRTVHWYRTITQTQTERRAGLELSIMNPQSLTPCYQGDSFQGITFWNTAGWSTLTSLTKEKSTLKSLGYDQ